MGYAYFCLVFGDEESLLFSELDEHPYPFCFDHWVLSDVSSSLLVYVESGFK